MGVSLNTLTAKNSKTGFLAIFFVYGHVPGVTQIEAEAFIIDKQRGNSSVESPKMFMYGQLTI